MSAAPWLLAWLLATAPPASLAPDTRAGLDAVMTSPKLAAGRAGSLVLAVGTRSRAAIAAERFGLEPYLPEARPELYAHNPDDTFTPASNLKVVTTAAGLELLGADFRFTTRVVAEAPPAGGSVARLWLVGGGDPSLGYAGLSQLAAAVKAAGVTRVSGAVLGDGSRYGDKYPEGWTEDDKIWYYGPEVWGLALERNQVDLVVAPGGAPGEPARVTVSPANVYVQVHNDVTTAPAAAAASLGYDHSAAGHYLAVWGKIPNGGGHYSQGVAVPDVPLYAATVFADLLKKAGVRVDGEPAVGTAPASVAEIAKIDSPPLGRLVKRLLKHSDNLYAEMLNREIGYQASGHGTVAAGVAAIKAWLTACHIPNANLHIVDGSGLSRVDLVTPRALAGIMAQMAFSKRRDYWWDALPIAGVDGTLEDRMEGTAAENNVRAKTGYISGRTALSGYATARPGADGAADVLVASTLFNRYTCSTAEARALHDRFFVLLAESRR
jgi:D-alanyl-D-alanine carboxypeptidase/D-alanyl-D-alanine-endopeptidase (penicillin-binding protein 4)